MFFLPLFFEKMLFHHYYLKKISHFYLIGFSRIQFCTQAKIFNNHIKQLQRNRAYSDPDSNLYDYLKDEVAFRVADRIFDIKRLFHIVSMELNLTKKIYPFIYRRFPVIVDLGTYKGFIGNHLTKVKIKFYFEFFFLVFFRNFI